MLVSFLQDRVNNQMTVLFNLITSQDARTGIEVARDSRTLATAIKLDSSSMKSLAVVSDVPTRHVCGLVLFDATVAGSK
jgi:hypothetical protein